jgi:hypothetical protein
MGNASLLRTRTIVGAAVAIAAGAVFATSAQAITIYSYDNLGPANVGSNGDRLIRFDSGSPNTTVVTVGASNVTNRGMSGLDFAGNGVLYSASGFNSDGTAFGGSQLFTVNTATGAATLVGNMNLPAGYAATDLSWNPVTNQMLMIAANGTANPGQLYTVNLGNGAATLVGNITGVQGSLDIGLASNSAGVNYIHDLVTDRMYSLAGTVATPLPSPIGVDTNFSQGMVINHRGNNEWFLGALTSSLISQVMLVNNATGAAATVPNGVWPTHAANGLPEYETGDLAIPIPEPTGGLLFAAGGLAMALKRRRAH